MRYNAKSKYNARKTTIDGITFASTKEGRRYKELKLLERAGVIGNLRLQVPYLLIPAQFEMVSLNGREKRRCIERACEYIADFVYTEKGALVVEDSKGYRTAEYRIKRKLMLERYGIRIRET